MEWARTKASEELEYDKEDADDDGRDLTSNLASDFLAATTLFGGWACYLRFFD